MKILRLVDRESSGSRRNAEQGNSAWEQFIERYKKAAAENSGLGAWKL